MAVILARTSCESPAKADYAVRRRRAAAAAGREADQGGADRNRAGDPAQLPGEHPRRTASRGHRSLAPRRRGWLPARQAASAITIADVIRAVEGPLASVRGGPPEESSYGGAAEALPRVWIAVRANLRKVVEHVTVADVASGTDAARRSTSSPRTRGLGHALGTRRPRSSGDRWRESPESVTDHGLGCSVAPASRRLRACHGATAGGRT